VKKQIDRQPTFRLQEKTKKEEIRDFIWGSKREALKQFVGQQLVSVCIGIGLPLPDAATQLNYFSGKLRQKHCAVALSRSLSQWEGCSGGSEGTWGAHLARGKACRRWETHVKKLEKKTGAWFGRPSG